MQLELCACVCVCVDASPLAECAKRHKETRRHCGVHKMTTLVNQKYNATHNFYRRRSIAHHKYMQCTLVLCCVCAYACVCPFVRTIYIYIFAYWSIIKFYFPMNRILILYSCVVYMDGWLHVFSWCCDALRRILLLDACSVK